MEEFFERLSVKEMRELQTLKYVLEEINIEHGTVAEFSVKKALTVTFHFNNKKIPTFQQNLFETTYN